MGDLIERALEPFQVLLSKEAVGRVRAVLWEKVRFDPVVMKYMRDAAVVPASRGESPSGDSPASK